MDFHLRKLLDESDHDSSCEEDFFCDFEKNLNGLCPPNCMIICPGCCRTPITTPTPPLPLPDVSKTHKPSSLLTVSLAILATSFFLFACYIIYKIFLTWYNSRRLRSSRIGNEESGPEVFLEGDQGPVVDHPIWYIRTVGLDPSVISSIAIVKYEKGRGLIEGTDCSVCLSEFQENESLRLLPKCNHAFHIPCIDTWLRAHTNCPMCRARVVSNRSAPISSSENVIVPNSGEVEETEQSGAENEDSDLRVRIEEEAESRAAVGLKINEIYGEENGIQVQPTRRSVSMDSLSASIIRKATAKASSARFDENSGLESVEMKETNGGIVEKSGGINRNLLRLVGSSSQSRLSQTGSSSMKRSASARVLISRYSGKSWNPLILP